MTTLPQSQHQVTLAPAPPNSQYNWIYKKLLSSPDDTVGALAYVLYKQQKIAFIEAIGQQGREPTAEEMAAFHTQSCLDSTLQGYRDRAEILAAAFLEAGLKQRISEIEQDVREGEIFQKVGELQAEMAQKKTWLGWLRDVTGNLGVNLVTIIVIGVLITGYKVISDWTSNTEKAMNVNQQPSSPQKGSELSPPVAPKTGN